MRKTQDTANAARSGKQKTGAAKTFPIVGIGASAGGLEAFTLLLKHLPLDTGMGFVLVQHLDPQHESALAQILARATSLPVREVTNNLRVQPNRVYIIPPNKNLGMAQGVLKLQPRSQARGAHRSIDFFFESLALDQRECGIGVILSGTATDGTLGLEAIKAEGGITFAQDGSAKYDSMPRSAAAAGCVDFVLSPEQIANELARIAKHPYLVRGNIRAAGDEARGARGGGPTKASPRAPHSAAPAGQDGFKKILLLVRNHSGVNFELYKPSTIQRRIHRRMVLNKSTSLEGYAAVLRGNSGELDALYSDLLINVTSFFRNPDAFDFLKRKIFPKLIRDRGDDPLRVWVLGCSTGQEAYSLAMALQECLENITPAPRLQIFATDLNPAVLDKARAGLYSRAVVGDVSPERLRRFFVEEQGGYRITKALRQAVVFAPQNLASDPPFSRMDLVTCRNVLIYLEPGLQKKAIATFHYALKPTGFLFLGASESISGYSGLFEPVDKKHKIYSRKAGSSPTLYRLSEPDSDARTPAPRAKCPPGKVPRAPRPGSESPPELNSDFNPQREADRVAASRHAPPSLLINADFHVLQFRGDTSPFLKPPSGRATFDLLKLAREDLLLPLRAALNKAKKANQIVRKEQVHVAQNGLTRITNLEVMPLKNLKVRSYLVFFEDAEKAGRLTRGAMRPEASQADARELACPHSEKEESRRIAGLQQELAERDDYLQAVQEQYEAAHEELQASSEEVTSANEELQSINEELETSKEELESANEELTTINDEMTNRNAELSRITSDLINLQASTHLPILLLGRDLTIRRFTPMAEKLFNLLPSDIGRSLSGVRHNLDLPDLEQLLRQVIDTVSSRERETWDKSGRWYTLRARPYMTLDNKIDGAVLVMVDIDDLKRTQHEITVAREYAESILEIVPPLLILDENLRVLTANESFYKHFQLSPEQTEKRLVYELDKHQWDIPKLRKLLEEILPRNSFFDNFEVTHGFGGLGQRTLHLSAHRVDHLQRILLSINDITERLQLETEVQRSELRYRRLFEAARDGILILDPETRKIKDANPYIVEFLGYAKAEVLGKELFELGLLKDEQASRQVFRDLKEIGFIRFENLPLETKGGQRREVEFVSNLYRENGVEVIQCNIRDISERKRAEEALRLAHAELGSRAVELDRFNRLAVGREQRVIELKNEVNELCQSNGQPPRHPLDSKPAQDATD